MKDANSTAPLRAEVQRQVAKAAVEVTDRSIRWRRLPIGAEVAPGGGVHFRVWAPRARRVEVALEAGESASSAHALAAEDDGYHSGCVPSAAVGTRYRYRLDGCEPLLPDPASRYQPDGPHGASSVIDAAAFSWTDTGWDGVGFEGQVLYELHVGTFTPEGTWAAASRHLPELARLGVTVIEMMPVADFPGRFGWGYDGVDLFAPTRLYGDPDDLRRFIDAAHAAGIGVILDVVYNHFGPDGNYLLEFSKDYVTDRYPNEWGDAINFDGEHAAPVREFFIANAGYWIDEFHFDGLRLDATQTIHDTSPEHILAAIARRVRGAGQRRRTFLVAENEPQSVQLVRDLSEGGYGLDALWNDDFHHGARVALTGRAEAYYSDYRGTAQELVSAVKRGYLYQGQRYEWQRKRRGTSTRGVAAARFVNYLQNHDQIANSGRGDRLHVLTSPARWRAMTALLLLGPATPLLFQGQEFNASSPWMFFADHGPELAHLVQRGRGEFLAQFPSLATEEMQACLQDPGAIATFTACRLDHGERERHHTAYALHADLLRMRREDPVFRAPRQDGIDGAVLGRDAFVLRFFGDAGDDRLLLVNLYRDLVLQPAPEPLLAPPAAGRWEVMWSSERPRYGGCGVGPVEADDGTWRVPGESAIVLRGRVGE